MGKLQPLQPVTEVRIGDEPVSECLQVPESLTVSVSICYDTTITIGQQLLSESKG